MSIDRDMCAVRSEQKVEADDWRYGRTSADKRRLQSKGKRLPKRASAAGLINTKNSSSPNYQRASDWLTNAVLCNIFSGPLLSTSAADSLRSSVLSNSLESSSSSAINIPARCTSPMIGLSAISVIT